MARNSAVVLLGSNIEPQQHLRAALEPLQGCGALVALSSIWVSPAAGRPELPDFHNAAVELGTELEAPELRQRLRAIEDDLGRVRHNDRFASRTIDLDLVLFGERVEPAGPPVLPDPDLLCFAHAIIPVAELDPTRLLPGTTETLGEIADRLAPGWRDGAGGGARRFRRSW